MADELCATDRFLVALKSEIDAMAADGPELEEMSKAIKRRMKVNRRVLRKARGEG